MSRVSILIVDDHAMIRRGLRLVLEAYPDLAVVGEAGTMQEAIDVAARVKPQVITLDLSMPGPAGVVSIDRLRAAAPSAKILVVTMHDDPAYVRSAIAMGAVGYINKSAADTELIHAIRAVVRGHGFIDVGDAGTLGSVLGPKPTPGKSPVETLSDREREVLREVARGYTNQQIADELRLSVKTVESYRARLMRKLGLKERADLVRVALDLGLI